MFIEELKTNIEKVYDIIDNLPTTSSYDIEKYNNYINYVINDNKKTLDIIHIEIKERYDNLLEKDEGIILKELKTKLEEFKYIEYLNKYNTSFEKVSLDKLTYEFSGYYKDNLEKVNSDLINIIDRFKSINIEITSNDFKFSNYAKIYITELLSNKNNIYETFNNLYWKCPDVIIHILINLKSIYLKNRDLIDKYCNNKINKSNDIYMKYQQLLNDINIESLKDKYLIQQNFLNNTLRLNDFAVDNIKKVSSKYYTDDINLELLTNLYNSLYEYKMYLKYKFLIDEIKNRYKEKEKYKNTLSSIEKTIKVKENKLLNLNKKLNKTNKSYISFFNTKESKINKLDIEINNLIKELKDDYNLYEESKVNYSIYKNITEESSIYDIMELSSSFYLYFISMLKQYKKEELDNKDEIYNELKEFVMKKNVHVINNISVIEDKNIPQIIVDGYKLFNIYLNEDNLNLDSIDNVINDIKLIIRYKYMTLMNISLNDIEYLISVDKEKL